MIIAALILIFERKVNWLKRITGILFLACFILPFLGTYSWLSIQRGVVREEVKSRLMAGIDKQDLLLLKFDNETKKSIRWEDDKEFEYNGHMYDVVKKKVINNSTYYWCWPDSRETKLNRQLNDIVAFILGNMPQREESQRQLSNFLSNLYHSVALPWHSLLYAQDKCCNSGYSFNYSSIYHSPPVPPPELS